MYFEFGMLVGMLMLMQVNFDVVILEVGLGGCLDVMNIVDNDIVVIISIGFDYQDWLGDICEKIVIEKVGIICDVGNVIIGEFELFVMLVEVVKEKQVNVLWQGKQFVIEEVEQGLLFMYLDG